MFLEHDLFHRRTVCYGCTKAFKWSLFQVHNRRTFDFVVYLFEELVQNSGKCASPGVAGLIPCSPSFLDETLKTDSSVGSVLGF